MKRFLTTIIAAVAVLAMATPGWGAGTDAGTLILNTATATYDVGAATNLSATASTSFVVSELVDVDVALQTSPNPWPVTAGLPAADVPLYYSLTNNGNGDEAYALTVDNNPSLTDQFDPDNPRIIIDTVNIGSYDGTGPGGDTAYAGPYTVLEDEIIYVWVLNDILDTPLADGDTGDSLLRANHTYAVGNTPGLVVIGVGDDLGSGAGDVVLGPSGGTDEDTGTYVISRTSVIMSKSILSVVDTQSIPGDQPIPGAEITFQVDVAVAGSSTVDSLIITDPVPTDTTYLPGSISLNGSAVSDTISPPGDTSGYDGAAVPNGEVVVDFGSIDATAGTQVILFTVTIN